MYRAAKKQRVRLLASVSAMALILSVYRIAGAEAADGDKSPLWLGLGWQYEGIGNLGDVFTPAFSSALASDGFPSLSGIQRRMGYSYGGEGGISFQPDGSEWIFSASVRYGRAHGLAKAHQQTSPASAYRKLEVIRSGVVLFAVGQPIAPVGEKIEDAHASNAETHAIVDFQAGKDVGLGIGTQSTSQLNFGVRFAQFRSRSNINVTADPDFHFLTPTYTVPFGGNEYLRGYVPSQVFHRDGITGTAERSFRGLGPSISWNATAALAGDQEDGELDLDWGVNVAALFGQQKTRIQHKTSSKLFDGANFFGTLGIYSTHVPIERSKRVVVPDVGGFAGISFRYSDAKLSLGYRADFFFNAIDGGIDASHSITHSFYGPFASIRIGVGGSSD